jgi:peptidoglycan biosynthesis protein MviN/MurJ (putative lipid II flippase)
MFYPLGFFVMNKGDDVQRRTVTRMLLANVSVAFAGVISTSVTAWTFGVGREAAVFLAAWSVTSVIERIFQAGQIAELAVPAYHRDVSTLGESEAQHRFAVLINTVVLVVCLAAAGLALLAEYIGAVLLPGLTPDDRALAFAVLVCTLPVLPIVVLGGLLQSLGNARGLYGRFELSLAVASLAGSVVVLCLHRQMGIWSLVLSAWAVQLVGIAGRIIQLYRDGYRHRWSLALPGYSQWLMLRELGYTSLYVGATQLYLLGLNAALTFLPTSAYGAFRYGEQLFVKTSSLFLRPISTVFYTNYSRELASGKAAAGDTMRAALSHFIDMWAIYATGLLVVAYPLMAIVWGGEKFRAEDIKAAAIVFTVQVAVVIFRAIGTLFRKQNLAHGAVREQYLGNVITQLISAVIAPFLVDSYGFNGAIAALAANMVLMSIADTLVAYRLSAHPFAIIPWGRIAAWSALVALSVLTARLVIALPVPEVLDAASKVELVMVSAVQLGSAGAVLFLGALWIGHGNLLYLSGMRRQP